MDLVTLLQPMLRLLLTTKYAGLFLIMFLDNTVLPLPGELVLIFAGYLIYLNQLDFWIVVLSCALGSMMGSAVGYWFGRRFGEPAIERYGRFVLLNKGHLHRADRFFKRRGHWALFYARFIPGVGHLISIPAGAAKMSAPRFLFYSFLAAFVWYAGFTYLCYVFSRQWGRLFAILERFQTVAYVVATILGVALILAYLYRRERKQARAAALSAKR